MMTRLLRLFMCGLLLAHVGGCGASTEPSSAPEQGKSRFPLLSFGGGHVLSPLRIVAIVAANDSLRDSLFAFTKAIPSSRWWREVATPYGISATATAVTVTGPALQPQSTLTSADLAAYVQKAAIDSAAYRPDGHTAYILYLPPGVRCTLGSPCTKYSSFHIPFGASDALAVVTRDQSPYIPTFELTTVTASHEIIEAATDPMADAWRFVGSVFPWETSPWALDDGGTWEENADFCGGTRYLEGGFYYQRVFTNQAAVLGGDPCVPAIAPVYYNVSAENDWYSTKTGEVTVPITGWAVQPVPDWIFGIAIGPHTPSLGAPSVSVTCPDTVRISGFCTLNNAKTAMLRVSLPPGAASKSFFTVQVNSGRFGPNGERPPRGEDYVHRWIIGVYVP